MVSLGFNQVAQSHRNLSTGRRNQPINCRLNSIYQSSIDLQQSFHFNFQSKFYQYGQAARQSVLQQNSIDSIKDLESQFKQYDGYIFRDAPTKIQTDSRVVVVGDVHGDMQKLLQSLLLAKVIEVRHNKIVWTGEDTIVVQLGDVLDRGNTEIGILVLLRRLDIQAKFTGGAVYMLNGNHEVMNAHSQFRSVSLDGYKECCSLLDSTQDEKCGPYWYEARNYMFRRGGPIAKELSRNPTTLSINNILFAHGGVLPQHCEFGLENINYEVSQWFNGHECSESSCVSRLQSALQGGSSIVWNRDYSMPCTSTAQRLEALEGLDKVLKSQDAEYMVIGHTPQKQGANSAFGGKIWRMDVGMSNGIFGTDPQVLDINWDLSGKANFNLLRWTPQMEMEYKSRQEHDCAARQCLEDSECILETQKPVISGKFRSQHENDASRSLAQQRSLAYV